MNGLVDLATDGVKIEDFEDKGLFMSLLSSNKVDPFDEEGSELIVRALDDSR